MLDCQIAILAVFYCLLLDSICIVLCMQVQKLYSSCNILSWHCQVVLNSACNLGSLPVNLLCIVLCAHVQVCRESSIITAACNSGSTHLEKTSTLFFWPGTPSYPPLILPLGDQPCGAEGTWRYLPLLCPS